MYLNQSYYTDTCPCKSITPVGDYILVRVIPLKPSNTIDAPYEDERYALKPAYGQIVTSEHPECPKGDYCIIDQYAQLYHVMSPEGHYVLCSKHDILATSPTPVDCYPEFLRYSLP
jgi:hypothetical protein